MATRASNRGVRARGSKGRGKSGGSGKSRMPLQLQRAYLTGKVAPRIRWGSPHFGTRCHDQAVKHGMSSRVAWGACQNLAGQIGLHIGARGSRRGGK